MKLRSFLMTCMMCPAQWDAVTDDGRAVYVRHRHGRLQVRVGKEGDTSDRAGVRGEVVLNLCGAALPDHHGDEWAGGMGTSEMFAILRAHGFEIDDGENHEDIERKWQATEDAAWEKADSRQGSFIILRESGDDG